MPSELGAMSGNLTQSYISNFYQIFSEGIGEFLIGRDRNPLLALSTSLLLRGF